MLKQFLISSFSLLVQTIALSHCFFDFNSAQADERRYKYVRSFEVPYVGSNTFLPSGEILSTGYAVTTVYKSDGTLLLNIPNLSDGVGNASKEFVGISPTFDPANPSKAEVFYVDAQGTKSSLGKFDYLPSTANFAYKISSDGVVAVHSGLNISLFQGATPIGTIVDPFKTFIGPEYQLIDLLPGKVSLARSLNVFTNNQREYFLVSETGVLTNIDRLSRQPYEIVKELFDTDTLFYSRSPGGTISTGFSYCNKSLECRSYDLPDLTSLLKTVTPTEKEGDVVLGQDLISGVRKLSLLRQGKPLRDLKCLLDSRSVDGIPRLASATVNKFGQLLATVGDQRQNERFVSFLYEPESLPDATKFTSCLKFKANISNNCKGRFNVTGDGVIEKSKPRSRSKKECSVKLLVRDEFGNPLKNLKIASSSSAVKLGSKKTDNAGAVTFNFAAGKAVSRKLTISAPESRYWMEQFIVQTK